MRGVAFDDSELGLTCSASAVMMAIEKNDVLQCLSDLMSSWLPRCVSLQEWAERRIPRDLASSVDGCGIVYVQADDANAEEGTLETRDTALPDSKRRRTQERDSWRIRISALQS